MKKNLLFILLFLSNSIVFASHYKGGEITYTCLGNNQYLITEKLYRDCQGNTMGSGDEVTMRSSSCGISTTADLKLVSSREVSGLCPNDISNSSCNGGSLPGVQEYVYQGIITLPSQCKDWIISTVNTDRNGAITNLIDPSNAHQYIETGINNQNGLCNNSPVFSQLPVPYLCVGQPVNLTHGAVDKEGDSLRYTLVNPLSDAGDPIAFTSGYSTNYPISTTTHTFSIDPISGDMSFTPNIQQVAVLTVRVDEYRNKVKIGSIMRDFQIVVMNCTNIPPKLTYKGITNVTGSGAVQLDTNSIIACRNNPLSFKIVSNDLNTSQGLTLLSNISASLSGATYSVSGSNPATAVFNVTPATLGTYTFNLSSTDNNCPYAATQVFSFDIKVVTCIPLPINLISFEAEVKEKTVLLSCVTSSPFEGTFHIERSASAIDFEVISQEINISNGNGISNYYFTDHDPIPGTSYYKLIISDDKGNFEISKSISVYREKYPEYTVSPNPACDYIDIKSNVDMTALVSIVDILGSVLLTARAEGNFANINIGILPPGIYAILIDQNNFIIRKKILVVR